MAFYPVLAQMFEQLAAQWGPVQFKKKKKRNTIIHRL